MTQTISSPPKKTPKEKLIREIKRIGRQITRPFLPAWGYVARIKYDLTRHWSVKVAQGEAALTKEVVLLIIYQPKGILASTYWQLDWLAKQGLSVIIVSHTPIADADRERLRQKAYLVIERPNVGYDFGGYREGVMQVLERKLDVDFLYVMNDSIWFPVVEDCDVFQRARGSDADMWGIFVDLDSRYDKMRAKDKEHIQSYFFRFSKKMLKSAEFSEYWRNIPLHSNRRLVIRHFENGMTPHFARKGFSFDGLIRWNALEDFLLTTQDEALLRKLLEYQCTVREKEAAMLKPYLARSELSAVEIRDQLAGEIRNNKLFMFPFSLHPELHQMWHFPFVKKSRNEDVVQYRHELRRLGMHERFIPEVGREIAQWDER